MNRFLVYAAGAAVIGLMIEGLEQFDKRSALMLAAVILLGVLLMNSAALSELAVPFQSKKSTLTRPPYFGDLTER